MQFYRTLRCSISSVHHAFYIAEDHTVSSRYPRKFVRSIGIPSHDSRKALLGKRKRKQRDVVPFRAQYVTYISRDYIPR